MPIPDASTVKKPWRIGKSMQASSTKGKAKGDPGNKALRRFHEHAPLQPERVKALPEQSRPVVQAKTLYPSTVVHASLAGRLLVDGINSRKLGSKVTKGAWRGMPIFSLTLEERATCPRSCDLWRTCYGNAMHLAKRIDHSFGLEPRLEGELAAFQERYPRGFVVRLHQLGDFYSLAYVKTWATWLAKFPALRVFGYTHWPVDSKIGAEIHRLREYWWDRFAIRTSVGLTNAAAVDGSAKTPTATTIWRLPEGPRVAEGIVCPAQTGRTECCGTCGLCWAEAAREETIVFVGHGMTNRGVPRGTRRASAKGTPGGRPRISDYGDDTVERVLALCRAGTHTMIQIATETGLSKGQVAGIVYRKRERT